MRSVELLSEDHRLISRALHLWRDMLLRLETGQSLSHDSAGALIDFFQRFADGCHHTKEERVLFPALERANNAHQLAPIATLLYEHDEGRRLMRMAQEALSRLETESGRQQFIRAARGYAQLFEEHMRKEEASFFRLINELVPALEDPKLFDALRAEEVRCLGQGGRECFEVLIDQLSEAMAANPMVDDRE